MDWRIAVAALSVLVAIASLVYTWRRERSRLMQNTAKERRQALISAMQNFARLLELSLQPYYSMHPTIVDVDAAFTDAIQARNVLWRDFYTFTQESLAKISAEGLESSHMELLAHSPSLAKAFGDRLGLVTSLRERLHDMCNSSWQMVLLRWKNKENEASSAVIGNLLRAEFQKYADIFKRASDALISPLYTCCVHMADLSDRDLITGPLRVSLPDLPTIRDLLIATTGTGDASLSSIEIELVDMLRYHKTENILCIEKRFGERARREWAKAILQEASAERDGVSA